MSRHGISQENHFNSFIRYNKHSPFKRYPTEKTLDILRRIQLPFRYLLDFYATPCICILYVHEEDHARTC